MENTLVIEGVAVCNAEQPLLKQTFTRVEYAISACYSGSHERSFFAMSEYSNFTQDISKATRYSSLNEALDRVEILKKYDLENIQIHEFNTTMSIGRTVTA